MAKVQLSGGAFQDPAGNPLANGTLKMVLSQDALASDGSEVAAGRSIQITLDINGNIAASPAQYMWPNDQLTPAGTFYSVSAYTAEGQLVWGPNSQQVLSSPSPYDVSAWVPNATSTATGNVVTYDVALFVPGLYLDSQVLLLLPIERSVQFLAGLTPSQAACGVNPTNDVTITLNNNGTAFGTITISTTGAVTLASGSGTLFNAGDILTIVGPSTPDSTLGNLGILLSGQVIGS